MASYQLLISEPPLQVLPTLATQIGLNEAIVLQQIHYWVSRDTAKIIDEKPWVYNTHQGWKKQFPFWSDKTIRRTIANLIDQNLIETRALSSNKFDKTLWYTLNYETLEAIEKAASFPKNSVGKPVDENGDIFDGTDTHSPYGQNDHMEKTKGLMAKMGGADRCGQNDHIDTVKMTSSDVVKMTTSYKEQRIYRKDETRAQEESLKNPKDLINIWNQMIAPEDKPVALTKKREKNLMALMQNLFESTPETWQLYCATIRKSDFLMGRTERSDWKINFDWACDPENAQKVLEGVYDGVEGAALARTSPRNGRRKNPSSQSGVLPLEGQGVGRKADTPSLAQKERETLTLIEGNPHTSEGFKTVQKQALREMGVTKYLAWFSGVQEGKTPDGDMALIAPSKFVADYLENDATLKKIGFSIVPPDSVEA